MQNGEAEKLLCFFVTKRKKRKYIYKYILRRLIYDKQNFEKDSLCGYVSDDLRINDSYGNQSRYAGDGNCNAGVSKHLEQKLFIGYLRHKLDIFGNAALKQVNVTENQDGTAEEKSGEYKTIETWNASRTGTILTMEEGRLINVLASYRLKVTFTAGSETVVSYAYPK